jgi:hypothetical protein
MNEITPVAEQAMTKYIHGSGTWSDIEAKWNNISNEWDHGSFYQIFTSLVVPEQSMTEFIFA